MPSILRNQNRKTVKTVTSRTTILHLNSDCLLEIFKYLSPLDMCSIKDTCRLFSLLAENRMALFYKSNQLILSDGTWKQMNDINNHLKIFFKFCKVLKHINMSVESINWRRKNELNVLSTIQKCEPKLDTLTITGMNFEPAFCKLKNVWPNLRKITLKYFDDNIFEYDIRDEEVIKSIFKSCKNVDKISFGASNSILGSQYQGIFLQQKCENLRSLALFEIRQFDVNNLIIFLRFNPKLQNITLRRCIEMSDLSHINFVRNASNIQGISMEFGIKDFATRLQLLYEADDLCALNYLKYLAFDACNKNIIKFVSRLAEKNSLNYLALINVNAKVNNGDELAKAFQKMTNLRCLRLQFLVYFPPQNFFKMLSGHLMNLIELNLYGSPIEFPNVLDIIHNSKSLKKLYLPIMSNRLNPSSYFLITETNYSLMVHARLGKSDVGQLTIFVDVSYARTILVPNDTLNENHHIIRIASFDPSQLNAYWIPTTDF